MEDVGKQWATPVPGVRAHRVALYWPHMLQEILDPMRTGRRWRIVIAERPADPIRGRPEVDPTCRPKGLAHDDGLCFGREFLAHVNIVRAHLGAKDERCLVERRAERQHERCSAGD